VADQGLLSQLPRLYVFHLVLLLQGMSGKITIVIFCRSYYCHSTKRTCKQLHNSIKPACCKKGLYDEISCSFAHDYEWLGHTFCQVNFGDSEHWKILYEKMPTFHNNCRTSASIFPGTFVAKILAISSRVTAISGVAYHVRTDQNIN
jgi:hypothetical protein